MPRTERSVMMELLYAHAFFQELFYMNEMTTMNEMTFLYDMTISFSMHMILFQEPTCYINYLNLLYDDMNTFLLYVHASFSETNMLNEWYYEHLSPLSACMCLLQKKILIFNHEKKTRRVKKKSLLGIEPQLSGWKSSTLMTEPQILQLKVQIKT